MDTKVMLDYGGPEFVAPGKKGFAVAPFKTYGFTAGSLNSAKNRLIKKISKDNAILSATKVLRSPDGNTVRISNYVQGDKKTWEKDLRADIEITFAEDHTVVQAGKQIILPFKTDKMRIGSDEVIIDAYSGNSDFHHTSFLVKPYVVRSDVRPKIWDMRIDLSKNPFSTDSHNYIRTYWNTFASIFGEKFAKAAMAKFKHKPKTKGIGGIYLGDFFRFYNLMELWDSERSWSAYTSMIWRKILDCTHENEEEMPVVREL